MSRGFRLRYAAHLGFRGFDTPLFRHAAASADPVHQIAFAAAEGLAGVLDPWFLSRPAADQDRIASAIADHGLDAGTLVCGRLDTLRTPLWLPRDADARDDLARQLDMALAAAARLGSRIVGVVAGRHPDLSTDDNEALFLDVLASLADRAGAQGVTLGLEAINPAAVPGLLLTSYAQTERLVRRLYHPAVGLMYDSAHLQATDGDPLGHYRRSRDRIAVVQIANHPGRTEPALGEIDIAALLGTVAASGYDGLVELEHLWAQPSAGAERAGLDWLRRVDATLDSAAN